MKRKRRYRQKTPYSNLGILSIHQDGRVHDFLKGYGTICKDGSILWDHWRPITKKQFAKYEARERRFKRKYPSGFADFVLPAISKAYPSLTVNDIINVQPMTGDITKVFNLKYEN